MNCDASAAIFYHVFKHARLWTIRCIFEEEAKIPAELKSMKAQFTSRKTHENFACALDAKLVQRKKKNKKTVFSSFFALNSAQLMWSWNKRYYGHKQLISDIHVMEAYFLWWRISNSSSYSLSWSDNHCTSLLYECFSVLRWFNRKGLRRTTKALRKRTNLHYSFRWKSNFSSREIAP